MDQPILQANSTLWTMVYEATPLMVGGVLYTSTSLSQVAAIDVATGSSIWAYPGEQAMPPGDVRGFDVRTGAQRGTFHSVPQSGEVGSETWKHESLAPRSLLPLQEAGQDVGLTTRRLAVGVLSLYR